MKTSTSTLFKATALALVLGSGVAWAGGQFTGQLPSAYQPFTGLETLPLDTNLASGAMPQTMSATLNQIRTVLYAQSTPLTGFSITVGTGVGVIQITPAGTLATGTFVFPNTVADGHKVRLFSTQIITAATLTPGTGQSFVGAVTTLAANVGVEYLYQASNTTWYRVM